MGEISLPFVGATMSLEYGKILWIESYRHRIVFQTSEGEYRIYRPLSEIEKLLDNKRFIRIHKSFIVNLEHVKAIGNYKLSLSDGTELIVAKGRYKYVKQGCRAYKNEVQS